MKWVDIVLSAVRVVLEAVSRVIFGIMYYGHPQTPLPPITNLILLESATALATKIRTRKVLLLLESVLLILSLWYIQRLSLFKSNCA